MSSEPRMSPRRRLKAQRTDLLLREAARLFAEHGYRGVSLEDLAAAVGISGPALYRHFPNKQAILAEVLRDVSQRLLDGGRQRVSAAVGPGSALEALVDFHTDFALNEQDRIRVHNRDLRTLTDDAAAEVRQIQRTYVDLWVDQLVGVREIDRRRARVMCQAVFGLLNSSPYSVREGDLAAKPILVRMALAALLS